MVTSCDPIDPYTATGTFGVSYNGGYKPDKTLQWIPPDTNVIDTRDDFLPPPVLPPPNMLMQTCEGRRIDPRVSGLLPKREMQFDDFTQSQDIPPPPEPTSCKGGGAVAPAAAAAAAPPSSPDKETEDFYMKILVLAAILLFVLLSVTKLS